jgi:hypothetical protein
MSWCSPPRGDPAESSKPRLAMGESLSGRVASTGEPLVISEPESDPRLIPEQRDRIRGPAIHWKSRGHPALLPEYRRRVRRRRGLLPLGIALKSGFLFQPFG